MTDRGEYEKDLNRKIVDLHSRLHKGAYRALPSRRVYICDMPTTSLLAFSTRLMLGGSRMQCASAWRNSRYRSTLQQFDIQSVDRDQPVLTLDLYAVPGVINNRNFGNTRLLSKLSHRVMQTLKFSVDQISYGKSDFLSSSATS